MKFSTTVLSALAPVALAKSVHNSHPKRSDHLAGGSHFSNGLAGFGITETSLTEVLVIWVNPGGEAVTTTINSQVTVTQTVTVNGGAPATVLPELNANPTIEQGATGTIVGTGATHSVTVGGPGGLVFTPDNVAAAVGDMVIFTFLAQNHTATQSSFDLPCDPLAGGMDSGFQANPDSSIVPAPQVAMQVMVDTPLWFFCAQGPHCGKGMTFSINPTADKTHAMFQSMAIAQRGNGDNTVITGGDAPPAAPAADAPAPADPNALQPLPGVDATPAVGDVASPAGDAGVVQGTGQVLADGTCSCAVVVGAGAFPAVGAQGVGSFGGMAGSLPQEMAEVI